MKTLSEMLEAIDVESADKIALRDDLTKLKAVAIELAKAIEWVETKYILSIPMRDRINRAKDIIGGE